MNIYFCGIGGVGLGPLAEIANDAGHTVSGSDAHESITTRELEERGITIGHDQSGAQLELSHRATLIDWFVYTSALPDNHPELERARALGIKTAKRDELINYIVQEKGLKLIAVAGTHGKTTTTGMLVWAFRELGVPVSYSVGSTISFGPAGHLDPLAEYFVYECDEFDRNFLHFSPYLSLITAVDYDHPDTYPTQADYNVAFRQFIHQSTAAILWQADAERVSTRDSSTWCLQDDEVLPLHLAGEHNRRNATLVLKVLERLGIGEDLSNRDAVESFPGTGRRFEKLSDNLYSDYGHHPVEIAATLQLAREINDHVVLVYQPHQNTRQHQVRDGYTTCTELADEIYWLPTYLTREDSRLPILQPRDLTTHLTNRDQVVYAQMDDSLWHSINHARENGTLVLCMGAGTIDEWIRSHLTSATTDRP